MRAKLIQLNLTQISINRKYRDLTEAENLLNQMCVYSKYATVILPSIT